MDAAESNLITSEIQIIASGSQMITAGSLMVIAESPINEAESLKDTAESLLGKRKSIKIHIFFTIAKLSRFVFFSHKAFPQLEYIKFDFEI